MVELAQARARAVVVPFQAGREEEQFLRAKCFENAGLVSVVPEASLSAETLASAVRERLEHPRPARSAMSVDGLAQSIRAIEQAAAARGRCEAATARLETALDGLSRAGIEWPIWWRDDDAVEGSAALDRLIELAAKYQAPLSLAVVPAGATEGLAARVARAQNIDILQHGWSHSNLAPLGEKKCELHDDAQGIETRLVEGQNRLGNLFGERLLPVLVPAVEPDRRHALGAAAVARLCGSFDLQAPFSSVRGATARPSEYSLGSDRVEKRRRVTGSGRPDQRIGGLRGGPSSRLGRPSRALWFAHAPSRS